MSKTNHREKSLISVSSFATKKNVSRQAVWYQINTVKAIEPIFVGMNRDVYVDWSRYKDFEFNHHKNIR